ncbi:NAD(P)-dependent oxidoreductase [Sphingopyxis sp. LC363]|jgi:3-hydroxyisobutyrate dehydrogenase-like beta-hydroxyacid dehydrogenase|uniref:NAD(P)-dependent oxidoreductase n=1 Tax=Sphingopyxis sp. LC363 TaxID=1120705 RepID=UPI00051011B0|nr:NAD(P)-dependent oxidoreductase [Sphingopyxis sp. LC363]KGB54732.1 FldX protein [Sphingopyxis sp. LC363]
MSDCVTFIGFGEAGRNLAWPGARAYDRKTEDPSSRGAMQADYAAAGVEGAKDAGTALVGTSAVLSVVTADQALPAAQNYAGLLEKKTLWFDMNSVAPGTKRLAAEIVESAGGRYIDVAIMAPVLPKRQAVPLLVAGIHAQEGAERLLAMGFSDVSVAGSAIGDASAIKMIRSVMVKGMEALSAECILAAYAAGVSDAVIASLDESWRKQPWDRRIDYNLDRMLVHGLRRAAEMEEAAKTLEELGLDPAMTRGTIARQRALGTIGVPPPNGLTAKLDAIRAANGEKNA